MLTVHLETTVISYLVALPSRDLIVAARQATTREWWKTARGRYRLVVSDPVLDEISVGDPEMAAERMRAVSGLDILSATRASLELQAYYQSSLGLAENARLDTLHLALASDYRVDYLVTWNLKHIANGHVIRRLNQLNESLRIDTPVIVTPDELMEPEIGGRL